MSAHNDKSTVIVGGGIAGLALARVLQANGVPYSLVERRRVPTDGGLAINLPGNAIQALADLGLRDRIEEFGHPLRRREYRTDRDRLLFTVDEDEFWGPLLRPRSVLRSSLLSILSEELPLDALRYDADVRSLHVHPTQPRIQLHDGTTLSGSLIVGADGVRSTIRQEVFGSGVGQGHALLAEASWRFMAPNPGIECWTVWAGADAMVLLMPVGEDQVYGWAAITSHSLADNSPYALLEVTRDFPARVRDTVEFAIMRPEGLYHSPLEEVRLDRWRGKRVVLIGDAAHATAPVWAEGGALGIEDAIILGGAIVEAPNVTTAIEMYEARRRPRVAHVQKMTDDMSRAAKLPPFVRNLLLPFVGPKKYQKTYGPLRQRG